ncbi:MAG: hypothetical protein AAF462_02745 [Thermodesulfobacteriota bacterium]
MSKDITQDKELHLSELDEFLASQIVDGSMSSLGYLIIRLDYQGNIRISEIANTLEIEKGGIDFELSPSEYQALNSIDVLDFTKSPVYTSSAYEFFDFMMMYFSKLWCSTEFNGKSWKVKIYRYEKDND